jgi:hypothetical protein
MLLLHHLKLQKVRVNMSAKNEHEKNCVPLCTTLIFIEIQERACENENKLFLIHTLFILVREGF